MIDYFHEHTCFVCHQPIHGGFCRDEWGNVVHYGCRTPLCCNCFRYTDSEALHLSDGRVICKTCLPSVVRNQWQINWVRPRVLSLLAKYGINDLPAHIYIRIDNSASINGLMNQSGIDPKAVGLSSTQMRMSSSNRIEQRHRVNILNGLHRAFFAGVLAHELMHIWQRSHFIELDDLHNEGFCELACYLMLRQINNPIARLHMSRMEYTPDPVYGNGFRAVRAVYNSLPRPSLPDTMRLMLANLLYPTMHGATLQAALRNNHKL